jgi:SAM-dependent methyltransferase
MNDETLLHRYHFEPGNTVAMLEHWRDSEGRRSYEVLAAEMNALPRTSRVLDLGCGDGYLLALLAQRGFRDLVGVDRSDQELDAAGERLGPRVELYCQDARELLLPARSVDIVVCHMALMLMESVESVLAEVVRILKPGGCFVAVINRPLHDPAYEVYRRKLHRITAESGMRRLRLGDPRAFTAEGLGELIHGQRFDGEALQIRDFCVRTQATPSKLWSMLRLMYDVFRLPAPAQVRLEEELLVDWRSLTDDSGVLTASMGMRLLKCRTMTSPRSP